MLIQHDRETAGMLRRQSTLPGRGDTGAFIGADGSVDTRQCGFHLAHVAVAYLAPGSRYYHDEQAKNALALGFDFLLSHQRPGGCLDLTSCNFDSAPDTAFTVNEMISAWYLLERDASGEADWLRRPMKRFIETCAEGVMNGGFHTPNHRWAISACLKHAAAICGRPEFSEKADVYLGEGLDIDQEGEFAERSGGIYNLVNDDQMIRLYLATGEKTYLEAARSNLLMMLSYIDPDGSVFTQNSTRQDNGRKVYLDGYYGLFLLTGYLLGDEALAAYSEFCWETAFAHGRTPHFLSWLLLYPDLEDYGKRRPCDLSRVTRCRRLFPKSNIFRYRQGDFSCSVMAGRPNFLYFQHGENTLYLAIYQNVCAQRNFIPASIEETEKGCRVTAKAESWYYLPYDGDGPATTDWWAMDNSNTRKKQIRDALVTTAEVSFTDGGAELRLSWQGLTHVPIRLEWGVLPGCRVRGGQFILQAEKGGSMTVCGGTLEISRNEADALTIGPAFGLHTVSNRMGGAYPQSGEHFTVFFSDFSPAERVIHIATDPLPSRS